MRRSLMDSKPPPRTSAFSSPPMVALLGRRLRHPTSASTSAGTTMSSVDPNNKNIAFFGGGAVRDSSGNFSWVVRTENGGTSWSSVIPNLPSGSSGLPHVDNHAIAFVKLSNGRVRMYLGNDGGIWRTDDAEGSPVTWINLNNPSLTLTQFYPSISINASSPSIAFGGTQDNGSQNYQGGTSWE